jgi:hypothetical protein
MKTETKAGPGGRPPRKKRQRACRRCGCTYFTPCVSKAGMTCCWVERDLCSSCLKPAERTRWVNRDKQPSRGRP